MWRGIAAFGRERADYFRLPAARALLSPFDPLVWERARTRGLPAQAHRRGKAATLHSPGGPPMPIAPAAARFAGLLTRPSQGGVTAWSSSA
ncbi:hypothetical protein [Frankia sp. QA3]|uniref:hypothetical protein n=1 Tax=Frankia sp. QA3 TaxID=710111 RepID=UPI001E40362E|nr:hypothetical protein [Frankia sp. QA3]